MEFKVIVVIASLSRALFVIGAGSGAEYDDDDDDGPPPRLEDIPDKYYDALMKEMPELTQIMAEFSARRNSAPYKDSAHHKKHQQQDPDRTNSFNSSKHSGRRIYQDQPALYTRDSGTIAWANNYISKKQLYLNKKTYYKSNCYWCGLNVSYFVPTTSICHDAFESQNFRMRALQRFFRGKCFYTNPIFVNFGTRFYMYMYWYGTFQGWNNMIYGSYYSRPANETDKWDKGKWGWGFFYDYGLKRNFFGMYIGGCFKRYLDVGNIYTQRGCKHYWPLNTYGASSAAHRFKKLEYVLRWKDEGCVSSTHASLTPFNRGISLYTRYHVCVCNSRYCNRASNRARLNNMLLWIAILLTCNFNFHLIEMNKKMTIGY